MNTPVAKKLPLLGLVAILTASLVLSILPGSGLAATCTVEGDISCRQPYIKATGGDVGTGGWFNNGNTLCDTSTGSNYQDSNFSNTNFPADPEHRYGGILTWAKSSGKNSAGGSSSEFAAYSLGLIEGNGSNPSKPEGFYSAGALAKNSAMAIDYLSFANTINPPAKDYWGGLMVAPSPVGVRQTTYCVPDYFTTKMPVSPSSLPPQKLTSGTSSGAYLINGDTLNPGLNNANVSIQAGRKVTIFVKGNVYIGHNITYASYKVTNVPKFTLVVQGSIYIGPNVTRLDGFYIAEPANPAAPKTLNDDTGEIWTCHDNTNTLMLYTYPTTLGCDKQLIVNGAFIAKQVQLTRISGDTVNATTKEDGFCAGGPAVLGCTGSPSNASEVINYSPAMVIGGSSFYSGKQNQSSSKIDSLISLPPVF